MLYYNFVYAVNVAQNRNRVRDFQRRFEQRWLERVGPTLGPPLLGSSAPAGAAPMVGHKHIPSGGRPNGFHDGVKCSHSCVLVSQDHIVLTRGCSSFYDGKGLATPKSVVKPPFVCTLSRRAEASWAVVFPSVLLLGEVCSHVTTDGMP